MFRAKFKVWALVLVLCVAANFAINLVNNIASGKYGKPDINISYNLSSANTLAEKMNNNKVSGFRVSARNYLDTSSDVEIIFSNSDEEINGFDRVEKAVYSPLVVYVMNSVRNDDMSSLFWRNSNGSYAPWNIDLYGILEAMEDGDTWQDLGMSPKVLNGPIELYISNKQGGYYDEVVELFYVTLNGGEVPSESERIALAPRVNALIAKCHQTSDVRGILSEAASKDYDNKINGVIAIAPEYLYMGSERAFSSNYSSSAYGPFYLKNSINQYVNVYLKSGSSLGERFLTAMKEKKDFMNYTGWRVRGSTFDVHEVKNRFLSVPSTVN